MRIENSFDVSAPPEAAWRLLNDVPTVVPCMPGAELQETVGENAWKAKLHVKLGPIALQFAAEVTREQMDESAGRVLLAVKAREARNRGSADATIESTLAAHDGGTRVAIVTELMLRGTVAQYGRGVVPDVARQLTAQFAECIAAKLREDSAG
jgi:carbon monoxide dehydrogenase subunit G